MGGIGATWRFRIAKTILFRYPRGWLGEAKVSCSFCHQGAQLMLAYSWARPAVLAAGKDIGRMLLFLLCIRFLSFPSFFPIPVFHLYYLFCLFSPFLWETTQNDPWVDGLLNSQHNQSISQISKMATMAAILKIFKLHLLNEVRLSWKLVRGIGETWRIRIVKIVFFQYPRWPPWQASWNSSNDISRTVGQGGRLESFQITSPER